MQGTLAPVSSGPMAAPVSYSRSLWEASPGWWGWDQLPSLSAFLCAMFLIQRAMCLPKAGPFMSLFASIFCVFPSGQPSICPFSHPSILPMII